MTDTEMRNDSPVPAPAPPVLPHSALFRYRLLPTRPTPEAKLRYIAVHTAMTREEEKSEELQGPKSSTVEKPE